MLLLTVTRPLRLPPENARIHDKFVGFGVPDEPIRRRRIMTYMTLGRCGHRPLQVYENNNS